MISLFPAILLDKISRTMKPVISNIKVRLQHIPKVRTKKKESENHSNHPAIPVNYAPRIAEATNLHNGTDPEKLLVR